MIYNRHLADQGSTERGAPLELSDGASGNGIPHRVPLPHHSSSLFPLRGETRETSLPTVPLTHRVHNLGQQMDDACDGVTGRQYRVWFVTSLHQYTPSHNNKIKTVQRQSYGIRDREYFDSTRRGLQQTEYALV
jgi:hypothetical protein